MHIRDLTRLFCVVLGAIALVNSFSFIETIALVPFHANDFTGSPIAYAAVLGVAALLFLLVGALLIARRDSIAAALFREAEPQEAPLSAADVEDLAFTVVGLYLAVTTLPQLGSLAGQMVNLRALESSERFSGAFQASLPHYAGTLLQLITGGCLFLYGNRVGTTLRVFRRRVSAAPLPAPSLTCRHCGEPYRPADYRADATEWRCTRCSHQLPLGDSTKADPASAGGAHDEQEEEGS